MRNVNNPQRGCGTLKPGGTYLRGSTGKGGTLEPWSWVLGTQVEGYFNLPIQAPPRRTILINLPYTLGCGRLVEDLEATPTMEVPLEVEAQLLKLPRVALLDHVGSAHYEPYQFAEETAQFGASRRIDPDIAAKLAPYLPMPILFTHSHVPFLESYFDFDRVMDWAKPPSTDVQVDPTFYDPEWGIRVKKKGAETTSPYTGWKHWSVAAMRELEAQPVPERPSEIRKAFRNHEAAFGISWINSAVYITNGDESEEQLDEYRSRGIEPVIPE